jgi:CelD/BcsL family acetyltransferase involved in cellulose biosynthesis
VISVTDDWSAVDWDRRPLAPNVGPFPHRGFLETWWRWREGNGLRLIESATALVPLHVSGERLEFCGEPDLTDYHTPLGTGGGAATAAFLDGMPGGTGFRFDSLPAEAAADLAVGLEASGYAVSIGTPDLSAVIDLPATFEEHLGSLPSKQRHEIRRKVRRFEEAFGPARLIRDGAAFDVFVGMHRESEGDKGSFMTSRREAFFKALADVSGSVIHLLVGDDNEPMAAAFGFETTEAYYLYNSAFEPRAAHGSPGIVLIERLIAHAIARGRSIFDLLKGDENYKFRMGAVPRRLYVVEGTT